MALKDFESFLCPAGKGVIELKRLVGRHHCIEVAVDYQQSKPWVEFGDVLNIVSFEEAMTQIQFQVYPPFQEKYKSVQDSFGDMRSILVGQSFNDSLKPSEGSIEDQPLH